MTKQGYVLIRDRKHPNRNHNNDVCEHIMIMSDHIQRPVLKGEIVHHIDFVKDNNNINNLHLYSGHSEHGRCVRKIFKMMKELLKLKIIRFEKGEYYMNILTERDGVLVRGEQ